MPRKMARNGPCRKARSGAYSNSVGVGSSRSDGVSGAVGAVVRPSISSTTASSASFSGPASSSIRTALTSVSPPATLKIRTPAELRPISTPAPRYPPEALRAGQAGEVLVEFTVNPDGSVSNARVVRADPPRVFDREAVSAVRRWRFEPTAEATTTRRAIAFNPGQ